MVDKTIIGTTRTRRFECFNEGCRAEFITVIEMKRCPYCESEDIYEMD